MTKVQQVHIPRHGFRNEDVPSGGPAVTSCHLWELRGFGAAHVPNQAGRIPEGILFGATGSVLARQ